MLRIEGLSVAFGEKPVLNGMDLEIASGETVAVIGESGSGKTTLGLAVMGLLNGSAQGLIAFEGRNILSLPEEELRRLRGRRIAMAFQNTQNRLNPSHRIRDQVAEPLTAHHRCPPAEARGRAERLLGELDLPEEKWAAYPHELSGGEQARAILAMALIGDPDVIILDEPISGLDAASRLTVSAYLSRALAGRTAILVTHDLSTAWQLAHRTATLCGGRIVESGPTADVLSQPHHPYTRGLIRSYPEMTRTKDLQGIRGRMEPITSGCAFHPRCTQVIPICSAKIPEMTTAGGRKIACHRGGIIAAIEGRNLSRSFGHIKAVRDASLLVEHGETLALVGKSGSGKTTLGRMLAGLLLPDRGEIYLEGERTDRPGREFHRTVQMIFQNPGEALSHRLTVLEAVREPLEIQGIGTPPERNERAIRTLAEVELPTAPAFLNEYPHHLSGGELQRVTIARALVLNPRVLIADEPTAFLDPSVQAKVLKLLLSLQENRGLAILFITHDLAVARKVSDRIAVMAEGRIAEEGPAWRMISTPSSACMSELLRAAVGNPPASEIVWRETPLRHNP